MSIDENGVLSNPVKKVLALADAEVARITVTVHAQNYADFTVTVMVYARNQIVPTGNPKLSDNGTITYGDKISKIQPVDMFPHTAHVECVCQISKEL